MEFDLNPATVEELEKAVEDDMLWEFIGAERLDDRDVHVYNVYIMGSEQRCKTVYVDPMTHIRWRTVTFNKLGQEVLVVTSKDVVIGSPDASFFEVPSGFTRIE